MKKIKSILITLLMAQTAVALALMAHSSSSTKSKNSNQLAVDFVRHSISRIELETKKSKTILSKIDGTWNLPDLHSLPVSPHKLKLFLGDLETLKVNWPVTADSKSHKRYQVDSEDFQNKVTLTGPGEQKTVFFIGKSKGFRKVYFRAEGSDKVYLVTLNTMDIQAKTSAWMDKDMLRTDKLTKIQTPTFTLTKSSDQWKPAKKVKFEVDQSKAQGLVASIENLRVTDVSEATLSSNAVEIIVTSNLGETQYLVEESGNKYLIKKADKDTVFTITKPVFESLTRTRLEDLKAS